MKKKWIVYFLLIPVCFTFYHINKLNYVKHKNIQARIIQHPEGLPNSQSAKIGSFGFTNIVADMYWLETIQYIGGNAIRGDYKKYLYKMMDLITDLNPYFESPYTIGLLLLPSSNEDYEDSKSEEVLKNIHDGEKLGIKGVANFCDSEKIKAIKATDDLQVIISDPQYSNPCQSYKIPYYLAYIYYFYLRDGDSASQYYKIVAAQDDAPSGAKILAAIMQGRSGEREKSLYMFLSLARSVSNPTEACSLMTQKVENSYNIISQEHLPLTGELLYQIEKDRDIILPQLSEENEDEILDNTQCTNFLAKATREMNLMYIDAADIQYVADHPDEISAETPQKLFDTGYINFIPIDYQQYEEKNYGIIYEYSSEIGRFDHVMNYR